jgi:hypothetical protein
LNSYGISEALNEQNNLGNKALFGDTLLYFKATIIKTV